MSSVLSHVSEDVGASASYLFSQCYVEVSRKRFAEPEKHLATLGARALSASQGADQSICTTAPTLMSIADRFYSQHP